MNVFTNVYGVVRSIIAASTLMTLAVNANLFPVGTTIYQGDEAAFPWNLFVLAGPVWGRAIGVAILALVVSGWRPRLTGLPHLWVVASFAHTPATMDGGEHVAQAMAMLLLPLTLLDGRRSHFGEAISLPKWQESAGRVFMIGVRLQVCVIYLEAFVDKFRVEQWRDGTALYYWVADPLIGSSPLVEGIVRTLLSNAVVLPLVTWSALALEFALAACLFADRKVQRVVLPLAVSFHLGIAVLFGISSFALIMIGCLTAYLLPWNQPLRWPAGLRVPAFRRARPSEEVRAPAVLANA